MTVRKNHIGGLVVGALGLSICLMSRTFPQLPEGYPGPGLFPSIIGILMALLGIVIVFSSEKEETDTDDDALVSRRLSLVLAIVLSLLIPIINRWIPLLFILPVFIFLIALLFKVSLKWALLISTITTTLIYLIFSLMLGVSL